MPAEDAEELAGEIMAQPSPLSALCIANQVADAIGAGPWVESLNAKGSERSQSSAAGKCFESPSSREAF
jgi:hypothetical protein